MAQQAGSFAIAYHPYRFRRVRTKLGQLQKIILNHSLIKRDTKRLLDATKVGRQSPRQTWKSFGVLFSQPLYSFLLHIGTVAKQNPKTNYLMVSSEATMFDDLGKKLFPWIFSYKNILVADKLNRRTMLRALAWKLAQGKDSEFNAEVIFRTICLGEIEGSRREVYGFFFGDDYSVSELVLNRRSEKEFLAGFLEDIRTASKVHTEHLRIAYNYVLDFMPDSESDLVIVDVGWGGTVQVLLSQFVKLHGTRREVEGLYLGVHPFDRFEIRAPRAIGYLLPNVRMESKELWNAIIWEYAYTNKPQFPEDQGRLELIQNGFSDGASLFQNIESNPKAYFDNVVSKQVKRLISKPTRQEVQTIGSIRFDCGFVDEGEFSIVDLNRSQRRLWLSLIMHPKNTLRQTVFVQNAWIYGYLKYYRMYGVKTVLRMVGFIKRRRYV